MEDIHVHFPRSGDEYTVYTYYPNLLPKLSVGDVFQAHVIPDTVEMLSAEGSFGVADEWHAAISYLGKPFAIVFGTPGRLLKEIVNMGRIVTIDVEKVGMYSETIPALRTHLDTRQLRTYIESN